MRTRPIVASVGLLALSLTVTGCRNCPWCSSNTGSSSAKPAPNMIGSRTTGDSTTNPNSKSAWNNQPARNGVGQNVNSDPRSAAVTEESATQPNAYTSNPGRTVRDAQPPRTGSYQNPNGPVGTGPTSAAGSSVVMPAGANGSQVTFTTVDSPPEYMTPAAPERPLAVSPSRAPMSGTTVTPGQTPRTMTIHDAQDLG